MVRGYNISSESLTSQFEAAMIDDQPVQTVQFTVQTSHNTHDVAKGNDPFLLWSEGIIFLVNH